MKKVHPYIYVGLARKPKISKTYPINDIFDAIEEATGYSKEDLAQRNRVRPLADARKIYYYLAKKYTNMTLESIGYMVNIKHCTLSWYSSSRILDLADNDNNFRIKLENSENNLKSLAIIKNYGVKL